MDVERALLTPTTVFACPEDVYRNQDLSRDQKIQILRQWEYDARELLVAEEENMGGGPENQLSEVLAVLHRLGVGADTDSDYLQPTKQGK